MRRRNAGKAGPMDPAAIAVTVRYAPVRGPEGVGWGAEQGEAVWEADATEPPDSGRMVREDPAPAAASGMSSRCLVP